jgi:hypothetical protein
MDMRAVLDKIAESLEGDISIEPDWLSEHLGVLPEDRVRIDPEVWAQVADHIERREAMRADSAGLLSERRGLPILAALFATCSLPYQHSILDGAQRRASHLTFSKGSNELNN